MNQDVMCDECKEFGKWTHESIGKRIILTCECGEEKEVFE